MTLAANEVARAAADGHTLLYAPSTIIAQNPHTLLSVSYDPFKDFTPITLATKGPLVLTVHAGLGLASIAELVAWAKSNPGKLVFASFGVGSSSHIFAEIFARNAGIDLTSWIGILGPAKLPAEVTSKLNAMFAQSMNSPQVREAIAKGAWETMPSTPEEMISEMRTSFDRWGTMIQRLGFQKQ